MYNQSSQYSSPSQEVRQFNIHLTCHWAHTRHIWSSYITSESNSYAQILIKRIPCMYPPTQPPAQIILTAKPFSRFHTNHWFSICPKVALCTLDLLIFTEVPVQPGLYTSALNRGLWAMTSCGTVVSVRPSPTSVVRALWSENAFLMTTQPDLWSYSKMFTISTAQICIFGIWCQETHDLGVMQRSISIGKTGKRYALFI